MAAVCAEVRYVSMCDVLGTARYAVLPRVSFCLPQSPPMAPHFISCEHCTRYFNTNVKEDFVCSLCLALDTCTTDVERQVLMVCIL